MKKNKKIAVYTCIVGDYDELKELDSRILEKNVDYFCFTNNKEIISKTWKIIYVEDFSLSNHMLNRKIKILGHDIINDYDILIYLDGNCTLKRKATDLITNECDLNKYPLYAFKHSVRNCTYDEADACLMYKKENPQKIDRLLKFYKQNNFPKNYGLCEMGCFIKKPKNTKVIKLMNTWYEMLEKYSERDQLSFMWSVYSNNFPLGIINLPIYKNQYLSFEPHKIKEKISKYRLYFGDSNQFVAKNAITGKYIEEKNNTYHINKIKVPHSTDRIEFEPAYFTGIELASISIQLNGKKINPDIKLYNYYNIDNKNIFYNEFPILVISGHFEKNDYIDITVELVALSKSTLIMIINDINNKVVDLNLDLENHNNEINKLKKSLRKEQKKYKKLTKTTNQIIKEKEELEIINNKITNSKQWKFIEKARKIVNTIVPK